MDMATSSYVSANSAACGSIGSALAPPGVVTPAGTRSSSDGLKLDRVVEADRFDVGLTADAGSPNLPPASGAASSDYRVAKYEQKSSDAGLFKKR